MRIIYQKGMFNIDNKNTDNSIYFSIMESRVEHHLFGLQCNHKEDSEEYKLIKQKCYAIYKAVKELDSLI